ncbi:hypothetical protein HYH03_010092 [Edaphochlamys debaryana]|uniref:Uncharacterized protein n=1 Tax=Edaphochlamys debaryana TaxID=47281 RepID=A0A836BWI1_9CHLO|nr:hypothetical protein HYH03_010092 [Edaphochlamys debaryana]|eukprot:KAG2491515.1 hypothetical protein HYH03_010092 [Edaphochlamys debaryana]
MLVSSTHGPRHLAKQHEVDEGWEACLAIPFASASASACQRIRQLRVIRAADDDGDKRVPGGSLLALLLRLRGVQQLELDFWAIDADWLDARDHLFETVLPSLTAATSVRVDCTADYENSLPLGADELRALLDGMPPSVQRLTVAPVWWSGDLDIQSDLEVDCCLTNGVLTSVNVCALPGEQEELPNHGQLSAFLAESLLPCNKLGPRLGRLGLQLCLEAVEHPPNPDPAAELLARCDTVELEAVKWCGASRIPALEEIWQRIAPPRQLRWGVGVTGTLHLLHADASGRGRRAGRGAGGSDRERSTGRLPPPLLVGDLVRRAAAHMATAAGPGHTVLCRGPGLTAALEASPKAVCKWLGMRARGAISDLTTSGVLQAESQPDSLYRPLPCAGACLLECQGAVSEEVAARTAELARQRVARAEQRRQGATGGGGGAAEDAWLQGVDVLTTSRTLNGAVMQELQELWDGAGPLLANDGSPPDPPGATGVAAGERVRTAGAAQEGAGPATSLS